MSGATAAIERSPDRGAVRSADRATGARAPLHTVGRRSRSDPALPRRSQPPRLRSHALLPTPSRPSVALRRASASGLARIRRRAELGFFRTRWKAAGNVDALLLAAGKGAPAAGATELGQAQAGEQAGGWRACAASRPSPASCAAAATMSSAATRGMTRRNWLTLPTTRRLRSRISRGAARAMSKPARRRRRECALRRRGNCR